MKTEIELQSTVKRIREESETRARKSINLAVRAFTERGAENGGLPKSEAFQALDRALHHRGEELRIGEMEIQELARTQGLSPDTSLALNDAQYIREVRHNRPFNYVHSPALLSFSPIYPFTHPFIPDSYPILSFPEFVRLSNDR